MTENGGPTVLISGGAGYIGSHVALHLRNAGFHTVVIDSLINGHAWAAKVADHFYQCDIADVNSVAAICEKHKPVAALHFAAFIEVAESVRNPEKYFHNNRDKAKIFFETLSANRVGKIVFSSTAAVYGEATEGVIGETAPTKPINPYGQSKLDAERFLRSMPVQSVALRYFNVAGAAENRAIGEAHFPESHLIPRLVLPLIGMPANISQGLNLGKQFQIYGDDYPTPDGTAIRDYVHVMDLAEAHLLALNYLLKGGSSEIVNLGSGNGYSVREVVDAAIKVLGRKDFKPSLAARREGDPPVLVASNGKALSLLGWQPRHTIEDMIQSAAAWHAGDTYRAAILEKISQLQQ